MPAAVTVMDCVVWPPGLHTLPVALEEVKTTLPPVQNVVGPPAEMVGVAGMALIVMLTPLLLPVTTGAEDTTRMR